MFRRYRRPYRLIFGLCLAVTVFVNIRLLVTFTKNTDIEFEEMFIARRITGKDGKYGAKSPNSDNNNNNRMVEQSILRKKALQNVTDLRHPIVHTVTDDVNLGGKNIETQIFTGDEVPNRRITNKKVIHEKVPTRPTEPPMTSPKDGPGSMGRPVILNKSLDDEAEKLFHINEFNLIASNKIPLNRTLPDYRPYGCAWKIYPLNLPTTSVVIVFHNEAWSTLLRTVHSVINRSPRHLLKEIVLVDDNSDEDFLKTPLDEYISKLSPPVLIHHCEEREGLIRARLIGANISSGDVITFLDSHCECTEGWLEPMLARIAADKTTVVCPVINIISDETFEYINGTDVTQVGGFDWRLVFTWHVVPIKEKERILFDRTAPVRSPTMAGGLFSIHHDFFKQLGTYDPGFDIWGGENLEISFKIWMCGGTLEFIPCSHVGHVFRKRSPHKYPMVKYNIMHHNNKRLAEVWLDEYKYLYYDAHPEVEFTAKPGDFSGRIALRKSLQCKSFKWYLETVYPETVFPIEYYGVMAVRQKSSNVCLDHKTALKHINAKDKTLKDKEKAPVELWSCHKGSVQSFIFTKAQELRHQGECLDYSMSKGFVSFYKCHGQGGNQEWRYVNESSVILHGGTRLCLTLPLDRSQSPWKPAMQPCTGKIDQQWTLELRKPGNIHL